MEVCSQFKPRWLYPRGRCRCQLSRRLVRHQNVCGRFLRIRTPDHPARVGSQFLGNILEAGHSSSSSNHDVSLSSPFFFFIRRGNVRYSTPQGTSRSQSRIPYRCLRPDVLGGPIDREPLRYPVTWRRKESQFRKCNGLKNRYKDRGPKE